MVSVSRRAPPNGCLASTCRQKAHGSARKRDDVYSAFGTSVPTNSCRNRQLPQSKLVYRESLADTNQFTNDRLDSKALTNRDSGVRHSIFSTAEKYSLILARPSIILKLLILYSLQLSINIISILRIIR
jgi:hypothetical protein